MIRQLRKPKQDGKPLFQACGIYRPHVPWYVPRKYFEMFPLKSVQLPPLYEEDLADLPQESRKMVRKHRYYRAMVEHDQMKQTVQAYLASMAYTDMLVGRLLTALDQSPHADNSIVVFWSDHGWHLGEKHWYRKFTLWEESCRVPLIIRLPKSMSKSLSESMAAGSRCERTVSLLDLYPTLIELCGLEPRQDLDGHSLVGLLKQPTAAWPHAAVSSLGPRRHTVRSERWRYIRYGAGGEELYDHDQDPNEWANLAGTKAYRQVLEKMRARLPRRAAAKAQTDRFEVKAYFETYKAEITAARKRERLSR